MLQGSQEGEILADAASQQLMAEEEKAAAQAAARKAKKSRQKAKKQQKSAGQHAQQTPSSHQQIPGSTSILEAAAGQASFQGITPCAPVLEQQAVSSTQATQQQQQQQQQCKDAGGNMQDADNCQARGAPWPGAQPLCEAGAHGSCVVPSGLTDPSGPLGPVTPQAVDNMVTLHLQQGSARCSASSSAWEDPANGLVEPEHSEHMCLQPLSSLQQLFCCPITKVSGGFDCAVIYDNRRTAPGISDGLGVVCVSVISALLHLAFSSVACVAGIAASRDTKTNEVCVREPQAVMIDPVIAADGHTYDKHAIQEWLKEKDSSPVTEATLAHVRLVPNTLIKNAIASQLIL